jgi:hypothetical protein
MARALEPRYETSLRRRRIEAEAGKDVGEVHADGTNVNLDLAGSGRRQGLFDERESSE